ncbi:hypothetical protein [Bacillus suaedae]|uniref:Uncharacterized protein n=1 Tax=Halalkalibacter suaedae TaxID=2822140 RepID=A0A940WYA6_9BACI|nr:hypothetical protein [Bacillus suaedae]MBP3950229.1 hypothetical protein [Bacillus suaedae]
MNKNDFRVQFPLWNIALFVILIIFTYGAVYCADMLFNDFTGAFRLENGRVVPNLELLRVFSIILGAVLLILFFISYFIRIRRHNKLHLNQKLNAFTLLTPNEFLEDDEMFNQVTRNATKKVYSFYSQMLPLIVVIMLFPIDRYIFIVIIFLTLIIQNALYYREIRHYIEE